MANTNSIVVLQDGPRNLIVKVDGVLDSSDLAAITIADPATAAAIDWQNIQKAKHLRLMKVSFNVEDGLVVSLFRDATVPVRIEQFVGRGIADYNDIGGLYSDAGAGDTGKILMSTQGWAAAQTLSYTLILTFVKLQS